MCFCVTARKKKKEETNRAIEPHSICTYIKVRLTPKLPAPFRFRVPSHSITNTNNSGVSLYIYIPLVLDPQRLFIQK